MPLEDLQTAQGLLLKVKQNGTKEELGHVTLNCQQLLQSCCCDEQEIELELLHPTKMLPGLCGSITLKCRPAKDHDIQYYKPRGFGYFKDYKLAAVQPDKGKHDHGGCVYYIILLLYVRTL
jgi:hypothetical protein